MTGCHKSINSIKEKIITMQATLDQKIGNFIIRLLRKENLTREETQSAFNTILKNETTEMQQGALLAALTAKGETEDEIAGCWEAIYEFDTNKVCLSKGPAVVENCGTGMDTFKTYNISTAASLIAAAGGIRMARHGARALTSTCGTVDLAEALGVDVECSVDVVARSIEKSGIGLFNGMSPQTHPRALSRILSQIHFGSTLNIAASLANPAMPKRAVRGVYAKDMIMPVIKTMKAIGYKRAIVLHGSIKNSDKGMDEASVSGPTFCAELSENGRIDKSEFFPSDFGLRCHNPSNLTPANNIKQESKDFVSLIEGKDNGARTDAALMNAGLVYYIADLSDDIKSGIEKAKSALKSGAALSVLENWVVSQSSNPDKGIAKLARLKN